ncbi:MAG: MgtC/SapB family protein [Bacteroidales bacterium]|nr:MgtC/SapB family protein [Bacteroidales bacterium]
MEITLNVALVRLLVSLVLGCAIGIERLISNHPAGVRTFMLITLGSTLATIASIYICQDNLGLHNGDPGRIAASILTGVGFIGAGLIIKNDDRVSGITTAACIFVTAVIGVAVGVGLLIPSAVATVAVILILLSSRNYKKNKQ